MANSGRTAPAGAGPLVESGAKVVLVVSRGPSETPRAGAVPTPSVAGKQQGDALSQLQGAGLNAQIVNDYSSTVRRGYVIDQFPEPGQMQAVNAEVVLLISSGPATQTAKTSLPDVVGLAEQDAVSRVQSAGLVAETVHQFHPNMAAGLVFAQLPSQASMASGGKKSSPWLLWVGIALAVLVLLGLGIWGFSAMSANKAKDVAAPNVVGMQQADATAALMAAGLKLGTVTPNTDSDAKVGTVLKQDPAAGAMVPTGGTVNLEVAGTPSVVKVPDLVGMSTAGAEEALKEVGLTSKQQTQYNPSVPKGEVVEQDPTPGIQVAVGSAVSLIISKGPEVSNTVIVPDVVGMTQDKATSTINGVGLSTKVTSAPSSEDTGTVSAQSPDGGVSVAAGSTVKITVSTGSGQ